MRIVAPFPPPPGRVQLALDRVEKAASGGLATAGSNREAPIYRPWDPSACRDDELRADIWSWCDDVARWLNHEYGWRSGLMIPPCWPQHPYLAHELPLLASLRYFAGKLFAPQAMEEWTRNTLPEFLRRLDMRTGESCQKEHTAWPAAPVYRRYVDPDLIAARRARFAEDVGQQRNEERSPR